jgi:hypothetical protein
VVNVTNGADVAVWLVTFEFCLGHDPPCYATPRAWHRTGGWLQGKTALFKCELACHSRQTMPVKTPM